ncbi:hypothetical protein OV203_21355 [Nannocystis sp. ILAH1]|uniref:hypothetical protein n=1 Tax=unclassified Nannocystis TaxID=2627009 RepID=UPI00226E73DB|nr:MULTISPECIES: hypothetical protein [unclassified Nannocystis]MCY0989699.1 hypothetical protein [Nannocystis sp. ILAH1]MCY1071208.1 hypothetical protein [Nannocystis sp. RBIL2]
MLTSAEFVELEQRAESFTTKNHHRFLSNALMCLRRTHDPVAAFELLARMTGRRDEASALQDVRGWYEQLLARPARLDPDKIELWLAWTRRLARVQEAEPRNRQQPDRGRPHARDVRPSVTLDAQLRFLRQRYPAPPSLPPPSPPPIPGAPPLASVGPRHVERPPLPQALTVLFARHQDAIKTLKGLAKQTGPGQHPPRPIPLAPVSGKFPAELDEVVLDGASATGVPDYLQALTKRYHGSAFPFHVTNLAWEGDRVVARAILLAPPPT